MEQNLTAGGVPPMPEPDPARPYTVGTLRYSLLGVIGVSFWLILGGSCFGLLAWMMVPTVLPLSLSQFDASGATIGLIVGSIPSAMNFIMNPILSTTSDRTRTRWGRRIPFLVTATPFVAGFVILLGWTPQIAKFLHGTGFLPSVRLQTLGILLLAFCAILFQFFNLIVGSIYYYIFADVIPHRFIGRYMAAMNIGGMVTQLVFNLWVMPSVTDHLPWVYTVVGIAYFVTFMLMCIFVKEGEYPPAERPENGGLPLWLRIYNWVALYFRQCYRHPFFIFLFLGTALNNASTACRQVFNLLFATRELGMDAAQYGKVMAVGAFISMGVIMFTGWIMDKIHPLRVFLASGVIVILANIWGYYFVFDYHSFFTVGIAIIAVYAIQNVSNGPVFVALFPPEKYGQFCSANAMLNSALLIFANYLGGIAIDLFGYRFIFVWDTLFTIAATASLVYVYIKWKQYGGAEHYAAPPTD